MPQAADRILVRLSDPWLATLSVLPYVLATGVFAGVGIAFLAAWTTGTAAAPVGFIVASLVCLSVFLVMLVLGIRYRRMLLRKVVLTSNEVLLPTRLSPDHIANITGVGLALQQATPGRGGYWGLMIWTSDGKYTFAAGMQGKPPRSPEGTQMAAAASQIYRYVLRQQGPNGALSTHAAQRRQQPSPYTLMRRFWDPSTGTVR